MTSLINMALGGNRPKVSKKVADILEYKEEFKAGLAEEALTLPDRKPFSDKKSRSDPRNDVIVCSRVTPRLDEEEEEEEEKLESFLPRNPFTFTADLSFTFKNETRVQFKKYAADYVFDQMDTDEKVFETVGDPLVDIALAGGSGLFISCGQSNSGKSKAYCNFSISAVLQLLQKSKNDDFAHFVSFMAMQENSCTDLLRTQSEHEMKESKNGSNKISEVIENKIYSVEQFKKMFEKVLSKRSREEHQKSTLTCLIRTRDGDPTDDGYLFLVCLLYPDHSSSIISQFSQLGASEQIKKSCLVMKECLIGRARTSANPDQTYKIPYKQDKLTKLLGEVLDIESGRQSRVVLLGNIYPYVEDVDTSTDMLKFLATVKAASKEEENVKHPEENPVNWDCYEVNMWLRLTHDLDIDPDDLLSGWQLLRFTRKEFVQFVLSKTSASCDTAWQIWTDLWQLYVSCREKERQRKLSRKEKFQTKDPPKKSYFAILHGDDNNTDDKINLQLGTSKRQFEAKLNKGFERNLPRYAAKNAEMMAMEWTNKVAASDRAEARLYPVLAIRAGQGVGVEGVRVAGQRRRKNSIYQ